MRSGPLLALLLCLASCGGANEPLHYTGTPGEVTAARIFANVFVVDTTVDGQPGPPSIIDTGSPVVLLSPSHAAPGAIPSGAGKVTTLGLLGLAFGDVPVLGTELGIDPSMQSKIAGIIGCTVLCSFVLDLNYRDAQVGLRAPGSGPAVVGGVADPVVMPFKLEGGGFGLAPGGGLLSFPTSRVVVEVSIEGTPHALILDSGASLTLLTGSVFNPLLADRRSTLTGAAAGVLGVSTATVARLRSVQLGTLELNGTMAATDTDFDRLLDTLSSEVGHPIAGMLGATFLREFKVTVDYPARQLSFERYATRDHIIDEGLNVGVAVARVTGVSPARLRVQHVYAGTDAASQGVAIGDMITTIDGVAVDALDDTAVEQQLGGQIGATHALHFGCAGCGGWSGDRRLAVSDLLALP